MLTDAELEAALAASPSPARITREYIESRIASTAYVRLTPPNDTVTICSITINNGFSVRGESACVDPANYRADSGEKTAYDQAFGKLWPLFGFLLAETRRVATEPPLAEAADEPGTTT